MIIKQEMYGVACDKCEELYECSHTGIAFKAIESDIKEAAEEDGWIEEGGQLLCANCMYKSLM